MSENKTIISGVDQENSPATSGLYANSLYSRINTVSENKTSRTVVPGRDVSAVGALEGGIRKNQNVKNSDAPVVGFLYSISRLGIGEYWPLHIGRNTIGRSKDNDICLAEASVSELHASLNIKQMKSTKRILVSIRDEGSSNGIFVNDEELDYSVREIFNNDRILIGENYMLVLIIIDAIALGLEVSSNFQATDDAPSFDVVNEYHSSLYNSGDRPENSTIAMDSSSYDSGKTRFMN